MQKNYLMLLLVFFMTGSFHQLEAQTTKKKCPDLEVTKITVDSVAATSPCCTRIRFNVVVKNIGSIAYNPSSGYGNTFINLSFTTTGYSNRPMARQPVRMPLGPGEYDQMIFEVNVDRSSHKLPEWENMPLPTSYCGFINSDNVPSSYECTQANNRLCIKNNTAILQVLKK